MADAVDRLLLDEFAGKLHDPMNDAGATTCIAGMLRSLPAKELSRAPAARGTANAPPTPRRLA